MRLWLQAVGVCALAFLCAHAQQPRMAHDAHPSFEVATIRPAEPGSRRMGFNTEGQQVTITNQSITSLVMFAYGVHAKQIVDGPALMEDRFNIHGTMDTPGEPDRQQFQEMLRKLLTDRFALKVHRDKRTLPVYTITVLKSGAKLQPSRNAPDGPSDQDGNGGPHGQTMHFLNNSMDDFALGMQYFMDRPVVNRTDLKGKYDFNLEWKPGMAATPDPSDFPDLFTAMQQELGLKFNPVKDTVEVLVVDEVKAPSEN